MSQTQSLNYFHDRLRFTEWANREWLRVLTSLPTAPPKAVQVLAHIVVAGDLWLSRIISDNKTIVVWPQFTLPEIDQAMHRSTQNWEAWFDRSDLPKLETMIAYTNSKGEKFSSSLNDILTHMVSHGNYHRGQIALLVRQAGHEPVLTDFIHATRNNLYRRIT